MYSPSSSGIMGSILAVFDSLVSTNTATRFRTTLSSLLVPSKVTNLSIFVSNDATNAAHRCIEANCVPKHWPAPGYLSCLCRSSNAYVPARRITRQRDDICCVVTVNQAIKLNTLVTLPSLVTRTGFLRHIVVYGGSRTHGQLGQDLTMFGHWYIVHLTSPRAGVDSLISHPLVV